MAGPPYRSDMLGPFERAADEELPIPRLGMASGAASRRLQSSQRRLRLLEDPIVSDRKRQVEFTARMNESMVKAEEQRALKVWKAERDLREAEEKRLIRAREAAEQQFSAKAMIMESDDED